MERGDGLVWLGETVHLAHGGDRRVLSMTLVDGERTRYNASRKVKFGREQIFKNLFSTASVSFERVLCQPNLSWDWYEHGLSDGDLIQVT